MTPALAHVLTFNVPARAEAAIVQAVKRRGEGRNPRPRLATPDAIGGRQT